MRQSRCYQTQEILGVYDKEEWKKSLEELRQKVKVPLEHVVNNNNKFSSEWCFKTRSSEEDKEYKNKDDELCCKENDNKMYNPL